MENNAASGASANQSSGAGNATANSQSANQETITTQNGEGSAAKTVAFSDHKRALDDMHKYKSEREVLAQENENLKKEKLLREGNKDELIKSLQKESDDEKQKRVQLQNAIIRREKVAALREECLKRGIRAEAVTDIEHFGIDDVSVEYTTDGRFITSGADIAAEALKRSKPYMFASAQAPRVNGGGNSQGTVAEQKLTPEYMAMLSRTDRVKYKELMPKYLEQRNKKA